jgi:hypothetical protein
MSLQSYNDGRYLLRGVCCGVLIELAVMAVVLIACELGVM